MRKFLIYGSLGLLLGTLAFSVKVATNAQDLPPYPLSTSTGSTMTANELPPTPLNQKKIAADLPTDPLIMTANISC